ncbi:uncharacterized protein LOC130053787 [Ostrea edulis]|uniref:uncharacterized protein LOC130053787 n=1 Tax=Ostrea edulis TaxID=37623 RepID=UPI0024AEEE19|nr:uncharacterized protein LOC130053787 [Ostrea edulis]
MRKDSAKNDIFREALRLFFPNGESQKGNLSDFKTDLWDFSERVAKESMTIQEIAMTISGLEELPDIEKDEFEHFEAPGLPERMAVAEMDDLGGDDLPELFSDTETRNVQAEPRAYRKCRCEGYPNTGTQRTKEMAHKEIIQAPMFVCDCFHPVVKNLMNSDELEKAYNKLTPTGRGVIRIMFSPENMSADELSTANHLKRFVKELTSDKLKRFLRFCTGSDLVAVDKITVNFVNVTGLARRPVAHTCGCLLELSKTFFSFPQFRSEFNSVLDSNYWEMDFI